jgi:hypothetical protein
MKTQYSRAAAWPLEKTNPLWRPAKENKGVASRRQSIFGRTQAGGQGKEITAVQTHTTIGTNPPVTS